MDFALSALSICNMHKRLFELQHLVSRFRDKLKYSNKHLHIKVTHEVTVQLPADWKPRNQRMKETATTVPVDEVVGLKQ